MLIKAHDLSATVCPTGWVRSRLADMLQESSIRAGDVHSFPVLSVTKHKGIVRADEYFAKAVHGRDTSNYKVVHPGEFAYATIHLDEGSIGRLNGSAPGIVSPMYTVFGAKIEIDPYYFETLLRSPQSIATYGALAQGTVNRRASISFSAFSGLILQRPPLPEQKKIAAVLSSVDAAIEKTEAVIAQLQGVKKAMMEQLLTKGLPGRHTRFKQTDLGVIPEDWEVVSLGSVIDGIDAGWSPQCESRPAANGEWGVLKISSVTWGTFDPTENKKLPDHLVPRPNIAVHAGDVLLSRANTPELVGRTVIVEQTYSNLMLSDKLLRLRINRLVAEPRFINLVLGAPLWRELIQDAATGSSGSMKNLSQEKLRALPIPKPATKEQDAIANIISAQDAVVRGEQLALDRLRTLKSALSSSLLSGELRVPTDSVPCPV